MRVFAFLMLPLAAHAVELKPQTDQFYSSYFDNYERRLQSREHFLLIDAIDGTRQRVRSGELSIREHLASKEPPGGLIHHWDGAVFLPRVAVTEVIAFVQNYDNHKNIYKPEVVDSKLLSREGSDFRIRMRLLKKKILTVVLETEHHVRYRQLDEKRWESISRSTKVAEVDSAGSRKEKELRPGTGHGFLWRTDSLWRFLEADGGVYMECSTISLSRDVPLGLTRIIRPILNDLPEESLRSILTKTRDGLKR
ncbi:MAG: hypothetical protein HYZ37_16265 [Candidatus Solibacter usitatus]|nr:hypothetical protein [Candidatus Solibacter usitatus]